MWKKMLMVMLIGISIIAAAGCGGAESGKGGGDTAVPVTVPAGPGPSSTDLQATADKVLRLTEDKDWAQLYDYLYMDIQKTISKEEFVNLRKQESKRTKLEYKNYKLGEAKQVPEWVDTISGKTYKNVAEVPYSVGVVTQKGDIEVKNVMHLIQTPEKNWRYLWIRK